MAEFAKARADNDLDTIVWSNGADSSPDRLYERVAIAWSGV